MVQEKNASLFSDNVQSDQGEQARPTNIRAHCQPYPGSLSVSMAHCTVALIVKWMAFFLINKELYIHPCIHNKMGSEGKSPWSLS